MSTTKAAPACPSATELIRMLDLKPLPGEGGFYRETWRSDVAFAADSLPPIYRSGRCAGTAIYYVITPESASRLHKVATDEVFHFYMGDPVDLCLLHPDGTGEIRTMGHDLAAGQHLQTMVPAGVWQGCKVRPGGSVGLLGTTVCPGFEFEDYLHGERAELLKGWPDFREWIEALS